jgi:transcriptional regulator with XRE-family HTH domain
MLLTLDSEALKRLRLASADSQKTLAERAGISEYWLMRLEQGRRTVRPSTVRKLAAALNVSVDELTEVA